TCQGKRIEDQLTVEGYVDHYRKKHGLLETNTTDDIINKYLGDGKSMDYYLNFILFERLGAFPVGSSNHVAENLPFYCNDEEIMKQYSIRRKGVLPRRQDLYDDKKQEIQEVLAGKRELPNIRLS